MSGTSSGAVILLVVVGGACCLSLVSSGATALAYNASSDFKGWVDGLFSPAAADDPGSDDTGDDGKGADAGSGTGTGTGSGGGKSAKAGQWVCPDLPSGDIQGDFDLVKQESTGVWWCQHKQANTGNSSSPIINNHHRASRLPSNAVQNKTYDWQSITREDGGDGIFGPTSGDFGSNEGDRKLFFYTA